MPAHAVPSPTRLRTLVDTLGHGLLEREAAVRLVLLAAPAYLEREGTPAAPEDLSRHDCLLYAYQQSGQLWALTKGQEERRVRVSGRLRINNGEAIAAAAAGGLGIAFMPDFIARRWLERGDLVRLLPEWQDAHGSPIYAIFPASRNLSPKVRVFLDFLVARFQGVLDDEGGS